MATQSPFSFVEDLLQNFKPSFEPPAWVVEESHRRVVLLLNHVLMQEPQAMERLVRQKGCVVLTQWRSYTFALLVTPAGLFDLASSGAPADLTLVLTQESPVAIFKDLVQGEKPAVRIEGDVHLAADINWLAANVRWDVEEDLARILGDVPAHTLCQAVRSIAQALGQFVPRQGGASGFSAARGGPSE